MRKILKISLSVVLLCCSLYGYAKDCPNMTIPIYHDKYNNYDYGFGIKIPAGLAGEGNPSPYPNHGVSITLNKPSNSVVYVDASYNVLDKNGSLAETLATDKQDKKDGKVNLYQVLFSGEIIFNQQPATRIVVQYKTQSSNHIIVEDRISFIAKPKNNSAESIYTLILTSNPKDYLNNQIKFLEIVQSWKLISNFQNFESGVDVCQNMMSDPDKRH